MGSKTEEWIHVRHPAFFVAGIFDAGSPFFWHMWFAVSQAAYVCLSGCTQSILKEMDDKHSVPLTLVIGNSKEKLMFFQHNNIAVVYLDFYKAFYLVLRNICICKLEQYNINTH